jgi:hypothetical protein
MIFFYYLDAACKLTVVEMPDDADDTDDLSDPVGLKFVGSLEIGEEEEQGFTQFLQNVVDETVVIYHKQMNKTVRPNRKLN